MLSCSTSETKYVQEEFTALDGQFDLGYCRQLLEDRTLTKSKLNTLVNSALGYIVVPKQEVVNEISEEVFRKHYRFGKYPSVRQWITFFKDRYGLLLTRKKLFEFVLKEV